MPDSRFPLQPSPPKEDMEVLEYKGGEARIRELEQLKPTIHTSVKTKLIEIFKNLQSAELKIYSEASKEFIILINGDSNGDILREYMRLSPKCPELLESWRLHQGKPGISNIFNIFTAIFEHRSGKSQSSEISRIIYNLAYSIFKEKIEEIHAELNSTENRRQNAALLLVASMVKRGIGLASQVAEAFLEAGSHKITNFSKLAGIKKRNETKSYTRRAFIRFAMSFIEVGNPRLLINVLQHRDIYKGVLRGISDDDTEHIVYVLSTLKDKVLIEESLIPPSLRSVLFGSVTLKQLSNISRNWTLGPAADLAHEVLVMVCTDPCNGLMPSINLKGNRKRLFDFMKKLEPTEHAYHKELLLEIVRRIPSLCADYMDEFPYKFKPQSDSLWFSAISLAADIISSVKFDSLIASATSNSYDELASLILKCIIPHRISRSVISTGLQHADELVKHGSLRIVLESLKSLTSLLLLIDNMIENNGGKNDDILREKITYIGVNSLTELENCLSDDVIGCATSGESEIQKWISLKELIQDEVRAMLPDPQVLLKLLSSSGKKNNNHLCAGLKRRANNLPQVSSKKLKKKHESDDDTIQVCGLNEDANDTHEELEDENMMQDLDAKNDDLVIITEIWGLNEQTMISEEPDSADNFFQSKLLDAFKFYLRTVPLAIEGSFDFFKILPQDPSSMSAEQLQSLLSLLLEHIQQAPGGKISVKPPKFMYKHLQRLINILINSNIKDIKKQTYTLVRAAMISTGAFDQNLSEVDAWLVTLTGHGMDSYIADNMEVVTFHELTSIVSSFLSDAVSTIGNNLYKYLSQMRELLSKLENVSDDSPGFSPLIICVLEKCLRLLESESKTYNLSEKSMISLYTCNAISLVLQTQVDAKKLSGLIYLVLKEKLNGCFMEEKRSKSSLCEWRPIKNLLYFTRLIFYQKKCDFSPILESTIKSHDCSLFPVLVKIKKLLEQEHNARLVGVAIAFASSVICANPNDMLTNLPLLLTITEKHFKPYLPFLSWVLFQEQGFLANIANLWSDMLLSGLNKIEGVINNRTTDLQVSTGPVSSTAFGILLYNAPFCALFSSIMNIENVKTISRENLGVLHSKSMLNLLQFKLSEGSLDDLFVSLRNVLFWINQKMLCCRTCTSDILEERFQMCATLVKTILDHISSAIADTHHVQDVIDLIFKHPIVTHSLSKHFHFSTVENGVHDATRSSENFHPIDSYVLQLLEIVFEFVLYVGKRCPKLVLTAPRNLIKEFAESFKSSIIKRNIELLFPRYYLLNKLMHFASPFVLLDIVELIFHQLEDSTTKCAPSFAEAAVSIGLHIMDSALDMLFSYVQLPRLDLKTNSLWVEKAKNLDVSNLINLYQKILDLNLWFDSEIADACLLKFVSAVYNQRFTKDYPCLFPLCTQLSTMIINSPMKMLLHCIYPTSKTKRKILLYLTNISSIHMNLFGKVLLGILNNDLSDWVQLNKDGFSKDDYLLLLPVSLSYLRYTVNKYGEKELKPLHRIASCYSSMLLDSFSNWKYFVQQDIFQDENDEISSQDFHTYCSNTLLGKAVTMLCYSLTLIGNQVRYKQLLGAFDSIFSDESLFDQQLSVSDLGSCSYKESLKFVNSVVAKISLSRSLLFPPVSLEQENNEKIEVFDRAKKVIGILVNTLDHIVNRIPLQVDSSDCYPVFKFLERCILSNLVNFCLDIQSYLKESSSIPILDRFINSSLHHRFEDPFTLRAIRCILVTLSVSEFSSADIFASLVQHPEFAPTITRCCIDINSSTLTPPLSSIFKSLDISSVAKNAQEVKGDQFTLSDMKLELVKLLRVLYQFKGLQQYVGSKELLSMLLCGYSATMSEIDLEIFQLMNEIETIEEFHIADMDYVWGGSSLKLKKELALEGILSMNDVDSENIFEKRKMLFRENIPVESKLSVMTVLHFCNDRASIRNLISVERLLEDSKFADSSKKIPSLNINEVQTYDPAYILRFSNHCLSLGYIEPTEFSRLGLLAITFVSITSTDEELRKLGYSCLGKFKNLLDSKISMNYEKKKDVLQLQLLLTYIQNGITEEWQRIPSFIAMFAAEASFILLNRSSNHFLTISKFLKNSNRMNLKLIPLFPELLKTHSIRTDRLWILRLLYTGLNTDIDAEIYKKQDVPKLLLSFGASSLSDHESKILILQIMNKCLKLPSMALPLMKKHGLMSWLSSILLFNGDRLASDHKELSLEIIELVLKVICDGISSPIIYDWLQDDALEQLSNLSSHLHMLILSSSKLLRGNISVVYSLLSVILSTLKISHYRKSNQPHFTLSLAGLFQLYQAIDVGFSSLTINSIRETGFDIMLISAPVPAVTQMDRTRLSKLLTWAIPAALQSFSIQRSVHDPDFLLFNKQEGNTLISKLLRWVSASVILGSISNKHSKLYMLCSTSKSKSITLQPILKEILDIRCESGEKYSGSDEALAVIILYLQQFLGRNCNFLPSVILALSLLLVGKKSFSQGCTKFDELSDALDSHSLRIYCPPEINPDWRWLYDEPWSSKDDKNTQTRATKEQMEEEQACQGILVMFSNILGGTNLSSSVLSYKELESSGLFEWERNMFLGTNPRKNR